MVIAGEDPVDASSDLHVRIVSMSRYMVVK